MNQLDPHRTPKGVVFRIGWQRTPLADETRYWHYVIEIQKPDNRNRIFTMTIGKAAYADALRADAFLLTTPLDSVKGDIDRAEAEGIDITRPPPREDWTMY